MKVIFMGTPDFAAGILDAIVKDGHEVVLAVTQCDKPKGRGKSIQYTPVKEKALEYDIPVYQPAKIKQEECVEELRKYQPDIIIVAAYGQILPKSILEMAKYGCVNVHASLLPQYRGAAPIQWSIIDGNQETGVTTMMMDVGLDTGDMIDKVVVPIADDETGGSLHDKLMEAGAGLILETMKKLEAGTAVLEKQDDSKSCYAKMLSKELGRLDFSMEAVALERLIRGLNPWPSAYTSFRGKGLKIWEAKVLDKEAEGQCGEIVEVTKEHFAVKTRKGLLAITQLQLEGKKRMETKAFLAGMTVEKGEMLGQ